MDEQITLVRETTSWAIEFRGFRQYITPLSILSELTTLSRSELLAHLVIIADEAINIENWSMKSTEELVTNMIESYYRYCYHGQELDERTLAPLIQKMVALTEDIVALMPPGTARVKFINHMTHPGCTPMLFVEIMLFKKREK